MSNSFERFATLPKQEQGVKVPLKMIDGTKTDDWLLLLGTDSLPFKEGCETIKQQIIAKGKTDDTVAEKEERKLSYLTFLINDWSFSEECNFDNKLKMLKLCPDLADMIDSFSARRSNFFTKLDAS